jgi:LytR cell envelope-related transcriptional attenuator
VNAVTVGGVVGVLALVGGVGGYALFHGGGHATAHPPAASPSAGRTCAPPPSPTATSLAGPKAQPIDVRVTVLNGSGTFGQAESVLSWMQNKEGFLRTSNGGAVAPAPATRLVYAPNHADQARTLAAAMHLPLSALHGTGKGTGPRDPMLLTLGKDFTGVGKPLATHTPAARATCAP